MHTPPIAPTSLLLILVLASPMIAQPADHAAPSPATVKPTLDNFLGLNVHTVQFKPDLYQPVARLLRDYHSLEWDVGGDTDHWPEFPFARNRVNWKTLYGDWAARGYVVNASIMFNNTPPDSWVNLERDAHTYGFALARYFGPGNQRMIASAEIGNEPGHYPDDTYVRLFTAMATGMRQGDSGLTIVTCATYDKPSGRYHKSLDLFKDLGHLYDAINVHAYAELEPWPTWRRSFPEDPRLPHLKDIQAVIDWRNRHAPGKPVWLTEFGYDASTQSPPASGDFKDWVGSTETQQAQYLVRSVLLFTAMDLDRAYIFFFNDEDAPHVHGSSGLTRNFQPKPSFHATAHLRRTLGERRFDRIIEKTDRAHIFQFVRDDPADPKPIWVAWSPTGEGRSTMTTLDLSPDRIERSERMPLAAENPPAESVAPTAGGKTNVLLTESPLYIHLR